MNTFDAKLSTDKVNRRFDEAIDLAYWDLMKMKVPFTSKELIQRGREILYSSGDSSSRRVEKLGSVDSILRSDEEKEEIRFLGVDFWGLLENERERCIASEVYKRIKEQIMSGRRF